MAGKKRSRRGGRSFFMHGNLVGDVAGKIGEGGSGFGLNHLEKDRDSGFMGLSAPRVMA